MIQTPSTIISVVSDVHLEFHNRLKGYHAVPSPIRDPPDAVTVCVIAGDLGKPSSSLYRDFLVLAKSAFDRVVVIAGNHEYWKRRSGKHKRCGRVDTSVRPKKISGGRVSMTEVERTAREVVGSIEGCDFLQKDAVIINGVRFLGCTLWTEILPEHEGWALAEMNDYHSNVTVDDADGLRGALPSDISAVHRDHRDWLRVAMAEPFEGPTVVVTHHLPSTQLIDPHYHGDRLNCCYASDTLDYVMPKAEPPPALWIHGHTHSRTLQTIGETCFVRNPWGYPSERLEKKSALIVISRPPKDKQPWVLPSKVLQRMSFEDIYLALAWLGTPDPARQ